METYLHFGENPFDRSVFSKLFEQVSFAEWKGIYISKKQPYQLKILSVAHRWIENNIEHSNPRISVVTLEDHMRLLQERKDQMGYTFSVRNHQTIAQDKAELERLHSKMRQLTERYGTKLEQELLLEHLQGKYTKQSIILYSKLVGQAKVELESAYQLPTYHYSAFRGIYKEYMKNYALTGKTEYRLEKSVEELRELREQRQEIEDLKQEIDQPEQLLEMMSGKHPEHRLWSIKEALEHPESIEESPELEEAVIELQQKLRMRQPPQ